MTLVAVHADAERADILTDTLSYTASGRHISHCSKALVLPHLEMAVATQGNSAFGDHWHMAANMLSGDVADYDEFCRRAPGVLRRIHADVRKYEPIGLASSPPAVFHVGYSPEQERFTAVGLAVELDDFTPWTIEGLHVMPHPVNVRPGPLELQRHRLRLRAAGIAEQDSQSLAHLLGLPPTPAPGCDEDWVRLAVATWRGRAMQPVAGGYKVLVGGDVIQTTLVRGLAVQRRVHRFDDSDDEYQRVMAGTLHPVGPVGPCECGSGNRYIDCCLQEHFDRPCLCGSQSTLRECCLLDDAIIAGTKHPLAEHVALATTGDAHGSPPPGRRS